jgi:hypothetical protein
MSRLPQHAIPRESITIRRLSPTPGIETILWQSIRELCCRTGNNGYPIASAQWDFFPRLWIDPYEKLLPNWTYVAEIDPIVIAYLTGCPDSKKFARAFSPSYCSSTWCASFNKTPATILLTVAIVPWSEPTGIHPGVILLTILMGLECWFLVFQTDSYQILLTTLRMRKALLTPQRAS